MKFQLPLGPESSVGQLLILAKALYLFTIRTLQQANSAMQTVLKHHRT